MLNEDTARFSVKDIGLIVGFTAAFVFAFSNLKQADSKHIDRMDAIDSRIDSIKSSKIPSRMDALEISMAGFIAADIPRRMDRLEYLICATEDAARKNACESMEVLK